MRNIFISFSGGESSALLLLRCLDQYKQDNILVCFANTGDEDEETLKFVKKTQDFYFIKIYWLEAYVSPLKGKGVMPVIVDFETASRDGKPLLDQAAKLGKSAITSPHCTRDLKVIIMHKFAKAYFRGEGYTTMQGIRFDEPTRINWHTAKEKGWDYPLARWRITKPYVNNFWKRHEKEKGFRLNLKPNEGNCRLCFKKSEKKLIELIRAKPCLVLFRMTMELVTENDKHDMYRKNRSIFDLLEIAKDKEVKSGQLDLFGGACFCS